MTVVNVGTDKYPDVKYQVLEVDGIRYPIIYKPEVVRGATEVTMRNDDVMLCGFPRSGTHWLFEIINMLLQKSTDTIQMIKEDFHVETATDKDVSALASPRVINGHLMFHHMPKQVLGKNVKIIYLIRDPRDVTVSMYEIMKKYTLARSGQELFPFSDWLKLYLDGEFPWGKWIDHVTNWERGMKDHPNHPILVVHYEELISNPAAGVARIGEFLNVEADSSLCCGIADKCQIGRMKKDKYHITQTVSGDPIHYSQGTSGRWKHIFKEADIELFNRMVGERMNGSQLCEKYRYSEGNE